MKERSGSRKVWALNALAGAVAIALYGIFERNLQAYETRPHIAWPVFAGLFFLAEVFVVNYPFRKETLSLSLNEIPLLICLFFASPPAMVGSLLLGSGVALVWHRRQPPIKLFFNLGTFVTEAIVASIVFRSIARPGASLGARESVAAIASMLIATMLAVTLVMLVIWVAGGGMSARKFARSLTLGFIGAITNSSLGLMSVVFLRVDPALALLLVIPAATLFLAYRGYTSHRRQHETLSSLTEATRTVQASADVEPAMGTVLARARETFVAEVAVITFFPRTPDEMAFEARLTADNALETLSALALNPTEGVWARVAAEGQAIMFARPIQNPRMNEYFTARGLRDAMVAPIWGRDQVIGTMLVGNRLGDVETFRKEDLTVFEAFVNHVGVALENVRLLARLQQSVGNLVELHRTKDEALAVISHELRTPLGAMTSFIDLLLRDESLGQTEARGSLELMAGQGERLRALIEDLLMEARLANGPIEPHADRIRVSEFLPEVVEAHAAWLWTHSIVVDPMGPMPDLFTDREILSRVLGNLIHNAAKNSPDGTTITIRARRREEGVLFSVEDQGVGIPSEMHERIFERFFRVEDPAGRKRSGIGLGLSICRRLASALGARVWVARSTPDLGSEFAVWVPVRPRPQRQAGAPARPTLILLDDARGTAG